LEKWSKYTLLHPFINCQKSKIKNSSLFPDPSHKKRIHVSPNKGPKVVFVGNGLNEDEDGDELDNGNVKQANEGGKVTDPNIHNISNKCNGFNTSCKMTSVIIGEATRIISKRSEPDVNNTKENFSQIQEALKENESKLLQIEDKMNVMFKKLSEKLDAIERKLEHDKIQTKLKALRKRS